VRIVSLLPSATEILFALGAGDDVVGVTFECDHPAEARARRIVSSTSLPPGLAPAEIDAHVRDRVAAGEDLYTLDRDALAELSPDIVVTQDLCVVCAVDVAHVDEALDYLGCRASVVTLDPMTLDDVLLSIEQLGKETGRLDRARRLVDSLRARIDRVGRATRDRGRSRLAVLEWTDPPFSSGHWVPDMVEAAGAVSALGRSGARSARIDWATVRRAEPDAIVVAPCGYHLPGTRDLAESLVDAAVLPTGIPVWAVDANGAFVRPGPRLVDGIEALAAIAHPTVFPLPDRVAVEVTTG
jgi:iron complex transport system substrate-binding protein